MRAIEACYTAAGDDRAWARGLLAALSPLGRQAGIHVLRFERGSNDAWEGELLASRNARPDPFAAWLREALLGAGGCDVLRAAPGRVELLSRGVAAAPRSRARATRALLRSTGVEDVLVIRADAAGVALVIAAPLTSPGAIAGRTMWQLGRFAEHLSSALRLRRCARLATPAEDRATMLPRPKGGRLVSAIRREAQRSGRPAAPPEAEELWKELVNGRWSVIDHSYEANRAALLLRRAEGHDPRALTPREREVLSYVAQGLSNKEIGYALGIGSTTVATHLRIAEEKMGRLTRQALIATLGASAR